MKKPRKRNATRIGSQLIAPVTPETLKQGAATRAMLLERAGAPHLLGTSVVDRIFVRDGVPALSYVRSGLHVPPGGKTIIESAFFVDDSIGQVRHISNTVVEHRRGRRQPLRVDCH